MNDTKLNEDIKEKYATLANIGETCASVAAKHIGMSLGCCISPVHNVLQCYALLQPPPACSLFIVSVCESSFKTRDDLRRHAKLHSTAKSRYFVTGEKYIPRNAGSEYPCNFCGKVFKVTSLF